MHLRQAGNRTENDILDAWLSSRGNRYRIAVAAEARGDPDDVHFLESRRVLSLAPIGDVVCFCHDVCLHYEPRSFSVKQRYVASAARQSRVQQSIGNNSAQCG